MIGPYLFLTVRNIPGQLISGVNAMQNRSAFNPHGLLHPLVLTVIVVACVRGIWVLGLRPVVRRIRGRRARRIAAYLLCLAVLSGATIVAQDKGKTGVVDGFWQMTAVLPDYDVTTTVRFRTAPDGETVEGVVLGPTSGRTGTFTGRLSGDRLSLTVPGPLGDMRADLTLSADTLSGTWAAGAVQGGVTAVRKPSRQPETEYYAKYLNAVCDLLRDKFYDPRLGGADLPALKARYLERLATVKDDGDFVTLVRHLLAETRTSHTDFFLQPDTAVLTEKRPSIAFRALSPRVSYLGIRLFDAPAGQDRQSFYRALEGAFDKIGDSSALIVDLRGNRGGNLNVMFRTLGRFVKSGRDAAYVAARKGIDSVANLSSAGGGVRPEVPVVKSSSNSMFADALRTGVAIVRIDAGQAKPYQGRIVALIDEGCYSSCELFAAILREEAGAVLVGRRSAGEVLGSEVYTIVKNMVVTRKDTGWRLEIPIFDFRTMKGDRIEGNGVKPDIELAQGGTDDAALAAALKYLGTM